jgi:hypothetical protein
MSRHQFLDLDPRLDRLTRRASPRRCRLAGNQFFASGPLAVNDEISLPQNPLEVVSAKTAFAPRRPRLESFAVALIAIFPIVLLSKQILVGARSFSTRAAGRRSPHRASRLPSGAIQLASRRLLGIGRDSPYGGFPM